MPQEADMIGTQVGNYRIVSKIGEGGMGMVYLAEHPEIGRSLAVKVLHPHLLREQQNVVRFINEAKAAAALHHPNVVDVIDIGTLAPDGTPYIVMERLIGEEMATRIRKRGRLSVHESVDLAAQVASALAAAHARGIVHRDLKPANLFLIPDEHRPGCDRIKILDFGVAKLQGPLANGSAPTQSGQLLGTPLYMSPEQSHGAAEVDHRSDIYSLGLILYEMLCGLPPFVSNAIGELVLMHLTQQPAPPRLRNPEIPEPLEQVILRSLAKDPAQRFQSATEMQAAMLAAVPSAAALAPGSSASAPMMPSAGVAIGSTVASIGYAATAGRATPAASYPQAAPAASYPQVIPASGGFAVPQAAAASWVGSIQPSGPASWVAAPPSGAIPVEAALMRVPAGTGSPPMRVDSGASYPMAVGGIPPSGAYQASAHSGAMHATRAAHLSVIGMPAVAMSTMVTKKPSRAAPWVVVGGALALVGGVLFFLAHQPAASKSDPGPGSNGSGSIGSGSDSAKPTQKVMTQPAPPPKPPVTTTKPSPPPVNHVATPPSHVGSDAPVTVAKPPKVTTPPTTLPPPPPPPAPQGNAEACARRCKRLGACGMQPAANCEQSCMANPQISACSLSAEDSCNGVASCSLASQCGGVQPSGAATCNATFDCSLRCGADANCACRCGQMMNSSHAQAWLSEQRCAAQCHGDTACVQIRCSRYILACQAN